ncbi:alpha/beta fold hydrolase [Solihabitans fulvus]|uniref:Alpha/beta fold hydrolase n=1 Tax=Solihabitans fulvus TaxID=1892852 RepID=A0A5B2XQG9_9PSEU|nr:alpha/beta fold hydrolase [Solihabitans fulvus]KAA2265666.1 alpha/beta fold hydrolase [Solihabitans fulvus]
MSTIVVSHGLEANGDSVWFPYLRAELEAKGHKVIVPNLPEPGAPKPAAWLDTFDQAVAKAGPAEDIVLVGHSIGGVNVLRMLEQHDTAERGRFAGAVLVSTASHEVGYEALAGFFATPFDWDRIRAAATEFRVLAAADDPVNVPDPVEHVGELVRGLGATAVLTATGGHLGAFADDHIDLPEAVRLVLDCLSR